MEEDGVMMDEEVVHDVVISKAEDDEVVVDGGEWEN